MSVDVWAWDQEHIREYRDKHEPPDKHEMMMLWFFSHNPSALEMWSSQGGDHTERAPKRFDDYNKDP
jgi:hypothetical protein